MNLRTFASNCLATSIARVALPVVMTIAFVAAADTALNEFGLKQRQGWGKTKLESDLVYSRAIEARKKGKRIVVFTGDSRVEWGVNPEVIQDYLAAHDVNQVEVFNLSYPGLNVRSIVERLNEAEFYPDILIVGYSHLSFYWSKLNLTERPHFLPVYERLIGELKSYMYHKVVLSGYSPIEVLQFLKDRKPLPGGSWLSTIYISPRGQARVVYGITENEAIANQKFFYLKMYDIPLPLEHFTAINEGFRKELVPFHQHGTKLLLLRMPLAGWALDLERSNDKLTFLEVSRLINVPSLDGNNMPGALTLKTFDGLHVAPPSDVTLSKWVAEQLLTPNYRGDLTL